MKKKIPYGLSNYSKIQTEKYFFIDKTHFIEKLEERGDYLIFLRPKKFGKSVLLSMLEDYYDIALKKQFRKNFQNTYISHKYQKNKNSFYILKFNFSEINIEDISKEFKYYLKLMLFHFIDKYKLDIEIADDFDNPLELLEKIIEYFSHNEKMNLFIMIDNYDSFANQFLFDLDNSYDEFLSKTLEIKEFVKLIRAGVTNTAIKKLFITGNTPIVLSDIVNNFHLLENISLEEDFNDLAGFREEDVKSILDFYEIPIEYLETIKEWYGGYKFNENAQEIYHPNMVWYFVKHYLQHNTIPTEMLDMNSIIHYRKLKNLLFSKNSLNDNFEILNKILAHSEIEIEKILEQFGANQLWDGNKFISLFFYLGFFAIKRKNLELVVGIPNEEMKIVLFNYMHEVLTEQNLLSIDSYKIDYHLKEFAKEGGVEIFRYISNELKNSFLNDYEFSCHNLKALYLSSLGYSSLYLVKNPAELAVDNFFDFVLKPFNQHILYFGVVSIIHLPKNESITQNQLNETIQDKFDKLELIRYDERIKKYIQEGKQLVKVIMVFYGNDLVGLKWEK